MKKTDVIAIEWHRLLTCLRRDGFKSTTEHVIELIQTADYPLAYCTKFIDYALKRKEFESVGKVIQAIDKTGKSHSLIDKSKGTLLWELGKHEDAIAFSIKSADHWLAPFLYYQASTFLKMNGKTHKADQYYRIAAMLATQEVEMLEEKSYKN